MTITATTESMRAVTRELANRVSAVSELLQDFSDLGELHSVLVTGDTVSLEPAGVEFDGVGMVAKWAQLAGVPVDVVTLDTSTHVTATVPHRGVTATVYQHLYGPGMWELSRRLQRRLGRTGITLQPEELLAALDQDGAA